MTGCASEEFSKAGDDALLESAESDDDRGCSCATAAKSAGMPSSGETGRGGRGAERAEAGSLEARGTSSSSLSPMLLPASEAVPTAWLPLPLVATSRVVADALDLPRPLPRPLPIARLAEVDPPRLVRPSVLEPASPLLRLDAGRAPGGDLGGSAGWSTTSGSTLGRRDGMSEPALCWQSWVMAGRPDDRQRRDGCSS